MERLKVLNLLSSDGKLILLHRGLKSLPRASRYDFVLSPQFYISKRESLPVKYAFQAKKLAPSILEDILPTDYNYEYVVEKDGDGWMFFAYAPKEIEDFLKVCCSKSPEKIGKIYFADQLAKVLKKVPLGIDEQNALTLIDNKATIVPRSMIDGDKFAKLSSKLRPKIGYRFRTSSKGSSDSKLSKEVIVLSSLIALLALAFIFDGLNYKKAIAKERDKLSVILEESPALASKLTRDSIKSKYQNIENRERKIRNLLNKYSKLTSKKSILDKLEISGDKLIAQFNVVPNEISRVESIAKSDNLKVSRVNNSLLRVEGSIR